MTPDYKNFAIDIINETLDCRGRLEWEGSEIQELALKYHIIESVSYDPSKHGPNDFNLAPGDPWFVFCNN